MILQHGEKMSVPTAKDGQNKESYHENRFMLSFYIIIVVEGRVKRLAEGRKEWNHNIKICLDEANLCMKTPINCFRFEFDARRRY
jgi:hypothetical protein